jgi:hypothetical protein
MFARVTTFAGGAERIESAVDVYREQALPWLRDATGFRGLVVLLDRESGDGLSVTFWDDEATARDEAASGNALRAEAGRIAGTATGSQRVLEVLAVESLTLD